MDKLEIFGYHVFPNNISDKNSLLFFFNLILWVNAFYYYQ
jgi:hypothetical protein